MAWYKKRGQIDVYQKQKSNGWIWVVVVVGGLLFVAAAGGSF